MAIDSHFLLSTGLHTYSSIPFVTFYPFWLQNRLEISVVTLIVEYILYTVDPLQMPVLPLTFLLTIYTLSPFLAQIPSLTQLHGSRPFALAFALTLSFQILSSISKIFSALTLLLLPHLAFLLFLLAFFLCFSLFPGFFHTRVDISLFSPFSSFSQFWDYVLPAIVFPRSPPFFLDHIHLSLLIPHALYNTSCILSYTLPFFYYCLFYPYS